MAGEDAAERKAALRREAKARLKAIGPDERAAASARAALAATAHASWRGARLVLAFLSMPAEIDTGPVIDAALDAGKRVAVPRMRGDDIEFIELAPGWRDWPRDRWDIPEPPAEIAAISVGDMATTPTLALVPGLAFDRAGGRLGRGKGYYDRFLSALSEARGGLGDGAAPFAAVGLGYAAQLVERAPTDERDMPLDALALG